MKGFLKILIFVFAFTSCSSSHEDTAEFIKIPFNLAQDSSSLDLYTLATNVSVSVAGCSSGYTASSFTVTGGSIPLYVGDKNCLVQLTGFTISAQAYTSTGSNAVAFTTWLTGDTAVFQGSSGTDLKYVSVLLQVTQSGVSSFDAVAYSIGASTARATSNVSQAKTTYPVPVSVTGDAAPNFTVTLAKILSINVNGSPNMTFTLQCGSSLTGSSTATYACSSVLLNTQLDYIFIPDAYSQAALTVAQLTTAFSANTPTGVGSSIIAPGGSDSYNNTLTNGGFYTGSLTGGSSQVNSQLNYVFMLRQKDVTVTDVQSYTYFYVNITSPTSTTVSGCGTTFAGGAGTAGNPYWINDAVTLANTVNCTSSSTYFIQIQNINLANTNWTPSPMYGQYNGNNHIIANLTYTNTSNASGSDALFSGLGDGASISNLNLTSVNITSIGANVAGLVAGGLGFSTTAYITNVNVSGNISATFSATGGSFQNTLGGIIGYAPGLITISNSSSSVTLTANESPTLSGWFRVGGLVGAGSTSGTQTLNISNSYNTGSVSVVATNVGTTLQIGGIIGSAGGNIANISQSYSTGNITYPAGGSGHLYFGGIGGFIATNSSSSISACFAKGTLSIGSGTTLSGGVVGSTSGGTSTISNSYNMVTLITSGTTTGTIGGFVGTGPSTSGISNSYSAAPSITFTGGTTAKGFYGTAGSSATNSYYFTNSGAIPSDSTTGVTGLATQSAMQTQANFTGFTFGTSATNWAMPITNTFSSPSGFLSPVLYWQCGANGISC